MATPKITVMYGPLPEARSASVQMGDNYYIALDHSLAWGGKERRTALAHELGHCYTGSFYNMYSPYDIRAKHEERANRWAFEHYVPKAALEAALRDGRDVWEISDMFSVTPQFVYKARTYYKVSDPMWMVS